MFSHKVVFTFLALRTNQGIPLPVSIAMCDFEVQKIVTEVDNIYLVIVL